jgi:hypothetical protein
MGRLNNSRAAGGSLPARKRRAKFDVPVDIIQSIYKVSGCE